MAGAELDLESAMRIVAAALAGERTDASRRIAVVVVDRGGHTLAAVREADAPPLLVHIAEAKAKTSVVYGKPTRTVMAWAQETPLWFHGVARVAQERMGLPMIASKGGVIVRDGAGTLIGAVGVAGEAGDRDETLAIAGIGAVGLIAQVA
ncbi:MAG: heme-binding protein [Rhizobiales bacterium]|nr:heme-binding protein [Hyphomicrobiales bacterium]